MEQKATATYVHKHNFRTVVMTDGTKYTYCTSCDTSIKEENENG